MVSQAELRARTGISQVRPTRVYQEAIYPTEPQDKAEEQARKQEAQQKEAQLSKEISDLRSQIDNYSRQIEEQQNIRQQTDNPDVRLRADSRMNELNNHDQ